MQWFKFTMLVAVAAMVFVYSSRPGSAAEEDIDALLDLVTEVQIPISSNDQSKTTDSAGVPSDVLDFWSQLKGNWKVEGHAGATPVTGSAAFELAKGEYCYLGRQSWNIGDSGTKIHLTLIGGWDAANAEMVEQGFDSSGGAATIRYRIPASGVSKPIEGSIDGTSRPDARWSGTITCDQDGPNEFRLTTTVDGRVVHSLRYLRIADQDQGERE